MALEAFDRAWSAAGEKGDKAQLMNIYADDYVGFPEMETKTSAIEGTMTTFERNKVNPARANKTTHDHYMISCTPTTATITHRNTVWTPMGAGGKPETYYTRSVHFLEKRGGKWHVVSNAASDVDEYGMLWYLDKEWNTATVKDDKAWFEENFAPDFTSVSASTGKMSNKKEDIESIGKSKIEMADSSDVNIRIDGNSALVTGIFHVKGTDEKGAAFEQRMRYTDTWIKRDGRWQVWSSQGTLIK